MRWFWLLVGLVLLCPLVAQAEVRKWTARTGDFTVEAELLDVTGGSVVLKKADGAKVTVPLDQLSLGDVRYVQQVLREATAAVGKAAGSPAESKSPVDSNTTSPHADKSGGPPLTKPNGSKWQVHPDPPRGGGLDAERIKSVNISLPSGFGSSEILLPAVPSPFVGCFTRSSKTSIVAWDLRNGDRLGPVEVDGYPASEPTLSPDGELVALAISGQGKIEIWSLKSRTKQKEIDLGEKFVSVQVLAFASPSRLLASTLTKQALQVFDVRSGQEVAKFAIESLLDRRHAAISPGGSYVALAGGFRKPLRVVDLRNGELAGELELPPGAESHALKAFQFSGDGQELAALFDSGGASLACWSLKTGQLLAHHKLGDSLDRSIPGASGITGPPIDFLADGKGWLLFGRAVIDREAGGPTWVAKSANPYSDRGLKRLLDGERLLAVSGDHSQQKLTIEKLPWDEIKQSAAVVQQGGTAADAGLPPLTIADVSAAKQVDLASAPREWRGEIEAPADAKGMSGEPITLSPRPQLVYPFLLAPAAAKAVFTAPVVNKEAASAYPPKHQYFWVDLASGKQAGSIEPAFATTALDLSPDGTRLALAVAPAGERVDIFEPDGKHVVGFRPYQAERAGHSKTEWAAFVASDRLLTRNSAGKLILWSLPDCKALAVLGGRALQPTLGPNQKYVLVFAEGMLHALDAQTLSPRGALEIPQLQPGTFVRACQFSPDGKVLAAIVRGPSLAALVTWDLASGKQLKRIDLAAVVDDLTWANPEQILVHHPLKLADPRSSRYNPSEIPPRRYDLIDLASGRVLWRYQLPLGTVHPQAAAGRVWYVATKDYSQPARLVGLRLPSEETAQAITAAPPPANLLPAGTPVTLDLTVQISGDAIADNALATSVREQLNQTLTKRGLKVEDRSALALRVELRERFTGRLLDLWPTRGGLAARYEIRGTQLECSVMLTDVKRTPLWTRTQTIPIREELPQGGIPAGVEPFDFVRQQQWNDALAWLTTTGIPSEILESWAYTGLGESVLSPEGEVRLVLDVPAIAPPAN